MYQLHIILCKIQILRFEILPLQYHLYLDLFQKVFSDKLSDELLWNQSKWHFFREKMLAANNLKAGWRAALQIENRWSQACAPRRLPHIAWRRPMRQWQHGNMAAATPPPQLGQVVKNHQNSWNWQNLSYAYNSLTNFHNAMTGNENHVNLLLSKLARKNSWNQVILFLSGFGPFGPTVRRRLTIIDREKLTVTITTLPTLQMFAGIYRDFAGKSKCRDFKFTGIACIPAISVIFEVNQKKCGLFIYTLY